MFSILQHEVEYFLTGSMGSEKFKISTIWSLIKQNYLDLCCQRGLLVFKAVLPGIWELENKADNIERCPVLLVCRMISPFCAAGLETEEPLLKVLV